MHTRLNRCGIIRLRLSESHTTCVHENLLLVHGQKGIVSIEHVILLCEQITSVQLVPPLKCFCINEGYYEMNRRGSFRDFLLAEGAAQGRAVVFNDKSHGYRAKTILYPP